MAWAGQGEAHVPCGAEGVPCAEVEVVACEVVTVPLGAVVAASLDLEVSDRAGALFLVLGLGTVDYDVIHHVDCGSSEAVDISDCLLHWQLLLPLRWQL